MSANNDILLDYFDSLLLSDLPDVKVALVDKQGLSDMLEVATAPVAVIKEETETKTEIEKKPIHQFVLTDTIASGQRLIPLLATNMAMNFAFTTATTTAMSLTMRLELLSLAAKLTPGRLKQNVLASCKEDVVDG